MDDESRAARYVRKARTASPAAFRLAPAGSLGRFADALAAAGAQVPVVLASRTGAGETLRRACDFKGSEADLPDRGLIGAGWLDPLSAG